MGFKLWLPFLSELKELKPADNNVSDEFSVELSITDEDCMATNDENL